MIHDLPESVCEQLYKEPKSRHNRLNTWTHGTKQRQTMKRQLRHTMVTLPCHTAQMEWRYEAKQPKDTQLRRCESPTPTVAHTQAQASHVSLDCFFIQLLTHRLRCDLCG